MADYSSNIDELATQLSRLLIDAKWTITTAESCTGGLVSATLTEVAGSSAWFERGIVSYSNESKTALLGVDADLIELHGAVSEEVALAMAKGARERAGADIAVAITGIAGPGGATADKPVGTVWIAWSLKSAQESAKKAVFSGDRREVRHSALEAALQGSVERVKCV